MGINGNSHSHSHYSREYWEWEWKFPPRRYSHHSREFWEWEWVFVGIPNSQKIPKIFFNVIVSVFKSYIYKKYRPSGFLLTVSVWKFKISTNRPREPPGLQPISGFNWKIHESDISWFTESNLRGSIAHVYELKKYFLKKNPKLFLIDLSHIWREFQNVPIDFIYMKNLGITYYLINWRERKIVVAP